MRDSVYFDSASIYLDTATSLRDKITKIDAIIDALLLIAADSADTENITEYSLDSGQTKIKTQYRGASDIMRSIENFEKLKNYYVNKLNGRSWKLLHSKNFRR